MLCFWNFVIFHPVYAWWEVLMNCWHVFQPIIPKTLTLCMYLHCTWMLFTIDRHRPQLFILGTNTNTFTKYTYKYKYRISQRSHHINIICIYRYKYSISQLSHHTHCTWYRHRPPPFILDTNHVNAIKIGVNRMSNTCQKHCWHVL